MFNLLETVFLSVKNAMDNTHVAGKDDRKPTTEQRISAALENLLSKFPSDFAQRSREMKREAEEIERAIQEAERNNRRGIRPAGKRFSL
ncbi:hypothetical protein G6L95_06655 [Agrobacterium rhizogenes]|nr:hypothetical protein [Rhizobium rhizogenes]NTI54631.1 hypothetical protein [Rhizobium rhizogenes]